MPPTTVILNPEINTEDTWQYFGLVPGDREITEALLELQLPTKYFALYLPSRFQPVASDLLEHDTGIESSLAIDSIGTVVNDTLPIVGRVTFTDQPVPP